MTLTLTPISVIDTLQMFQFRFLRAQILVLSGSYELCPFFYGSAFSIGSSQKPTCLNQGGAQPRYTVEVQQIVVVLVEYKFLVFPYTQNFHPY